jgi:hypothetical protein
MKKSKAKIFLITNLVSARNETHEFTPENYLNLVIKYTGCNLNVMVVPKLSRLEFENKYKKVSHLYDLEHSHFMGWEDKELKSIQRKGIKIVKHDAIKIIDVEEENTKIIRHDPEKLAETLSPLL